MATFEKFYVSRETGAAIAGDSFFVCPSNCWAIITILTTNNTTAGTLGAFRQGENQASHYASTPTLVGVSLMIGPGETAFVTGANVTYSVERLPV